MQDDFFRFEGRHEPEDDDDDDDDIIDPVYKSDDEDEPEITASNPQFVKLLYLRIENNTKKPNLFNSNLWSHI